MKNESWADRLVNVLIWGNSEGTPLQHKKKKEEDWFTTQHPTSPANNIPAGYDSEGNMTNY